MRRSDQFVRLIQHRLDTLNIKADAPTKEWTAAVKTRFCDTGRLFGYWVGARADEVAANKRDGGEWLYDVVWLDYDEDDFLTSVPLVAECEWDPRREWIDDDFQKLLLARADSRIMVFTGSEPGYSREVANRLIGQIEWFRNADDDGDLRWLLSAWENSDKGRGWRFRHFTIWEGKLHEFRLSEDVE